MNWVFRECGQCGGRWPLGESPTCKCSRFSYTTPLVPVGKREWVGLTDEEIDDLLGNMSLGSVDEDVKLIEAKLREKNK